MLGSSEEIMSMAAAQVQSCRAYISIEPIDELTVKTQRQQLNDRFLRCSDHDDDDRGTSASIYWNPSFEYLRAIHVRPRDPDSSHPPKLVLLFSHYNEMNHKIFTCYRDHQKSLAKIILSKCEDSYPGNKHGVIGINSINSCDGYHKRSDFRHGSYLIQLAIEYSFQQGYEGRVDLFSTNGSGKFYFKLGFLPKHLTESILKGFQTGQDIDGFDMYLPQASIDAWKEKIRQYPIILSEEEVNALVLNSENSKQQHLNKRLNSLLSGNIYHPNVLIRLLEEGADLSAITNGYKALHMLVDYGTNRDHDTLIQTLINQYNANINIKDPNGRTPLHNLILNTPAVNCDFVQWLVNLGSDVNTRDNDGQTLLEATTRTKNQNVIHFLEQCTVTRNVSGTNPAHTVINDRTNVSCISMQVLSGFMMVLGTVAVAVAFTILNAATFNAV
ncbi:MAG: ankyrin repeat domain-containing protein, partial [Legionella sp.]